MGDKLSHFSFCEKSPLTQLIVSLVIIVVAGMAVFTLLLVAGAVVFKVDPELLSQYASSLEIDNVSFLRYMLAIQGISLFIIPGLLILTLMKDNNCQRVTNNPSKGVLDVALIILLVVAIIPVISLTGRLNSALQLPDWLSGLESWMQEKENYANDLTGLVIASDNFIDMLLNLIIIAVIPAIGEELIFRGVFQKISYKLFKSTHIAILVTAVFFSTLHLQFYGFIPRLILGLVFGYLFLWGGSLWYPILAHFLNNGIPVLGAYIMGWEGIDRQKDILRGNQVFWLLLSLIISALILNYFSKKYQKSQKDWSINKHQLTG